jgi:hypothetical protein
LIGGASRKQRGLASSSISSGLYAGTQATGAYSPADVASVARTRASGPGLQATGLNARITLGSALWPARVSHCEKRRSDRDIDVRRARVDVLRRRRWTLRNTAPASRTSARGPAHVDGRG